MKHTNSLRGNASAAGSFVWVSIAIYALTLTIGIAAYLSNTARSVSSNYELAASHWLQSESLYSESKIIGHGFLYLPQAAIFHIPFALLSEWTGVKEAGDVAFRIASWVVLAVCCFRFTRLAGHEDGFSQVLMALAVSAVGVSCIRIGQSTVMMTALMLLSLDMWRLGRYNWSAVCIAVAIGVKPLAIVLALLLFAVSRTMRVRLILCAIGLAALPFVSQSPLYAWNQYRDCFAMMGIAAESGNQSYWAQLFCMLRIFGVPLSGPVQNVIRMIAALGTLVLAFMAVARVEQARAAYWLFHLSVFFLMLFNPRTENTTYLMMGPVYGLLIANNMASTKRVFLKVLPWVLMICTAGSYEIGKFFTRAGDFPVWLAPLCCCVTIGLLVYNNLPKKWTARILTYPANQKICSGRSIRKQ